MNPFKTVPAMITLVSAIKKFNSHVPEFEALRAAGDDKTEQAKILEYINEFGDEITRKYKVNFEVYGEENIPDHGPLMVYSNHQSFADILAVFTNFRKFQIGFVAKNEWHSWDILAKAIEYTRSIFLVRGGGRRALEALAQTEDYLKRGFSLVIFPEGTRSQSHEMGEFKYGAFKFAQRGNVPILPMSVDGGFKIFEIDNSFHDGVTVRMKIHPMVHIENMSRAEQKEAFNQIEQTIRDGVKELVEMEENA